MRGGRLSMGEALGAAATRLGPIAVWTLLSVGVGLLLQQIASRIPEAVGSTWLAGAAWTLATIFVVPVLVVESEDAIPAVRQLGVADQAALGRGHRRIADDRRLAHRRHDPRLHRARGRGRPRPLRTRRRLRADRGGRGRDRGDRHRGLRNAGNFALALYCYAVDGEVRVFAPGDLDQPFSGRGKRATNRD